LSRSNSPDLEDAGTEQMANGYQKFHIEAPIIPHEFSAMRSRPSGTLPEKLDAMPAERAAKVAEEVKEAITPFFRDEE
jgi:hypothetical protein